MNIEEIRDYCLSMKATSEGFPFDEDVLVFKVLGKMFALMSLKTWEEGEPYINLKCDPEYALELRETFESVKPGYHMSKVHWNSVYLNQGDLSPKQIYQLIDHSYDKIVESLSKKQRADLESL